MKIFLVRYKPIIVYYFLACLFSWPFFLWRDVYSDHWEGLDLDIVIKTSLIMWGPGLSAIICSLIFKEKVIKTITLFGTSILRSLLFWGVPMIAFIFWGEYNVSFTKIIIYLGGVFLFTLGEELGWRGFMQDQLNHLPKWKRYLIIGAMWEFWHFTTRTLSGGIFARILRPLIFILPNSILSYIFGESVNKSKSIIVAVTLHAWFNLLIEFANTQTFIIFSFSIIFWIIMLSSWNKPFKLKNIFFK
ncbi:MAG: CPBP family intramembrane metalloprotease [Flavobacteriales bacterium]|nr:CPBP family intramembrane metalloprotease [Flavobacteriales bacterium]